MYYLSKVLLSKEDFNREPMQILNSQQKRNLWNVFALIFIITASTFILTRYYSDSISHHEPVGYDGDSLAVLSHIKACQEGGMKPLFIPVRIARLNAPDEALWSDVPISKIVYWIPSLMSRYTDLFTASTLFVILSLCGAGAAFYFTAIILGCRPIPSATMGLLYALLPYGFVRNIEHLALTLYFVVPIYILCVLRIWGPAGVFRSNRELLWLGIAVFLSSLFNPYYWAMFLVLMGIVWLGHLANRSWRGVWISSAFGAAAVVGFLIQNADTFYFRHLMGFNATAISRDLWWMTKFGLYLPDILLPPTDRWTLIEKVSAQNYYTKIPIPLQGESQTAYIGIIAGIGLIILLLSGFISASADRKRDQSPLFWTSLIIFCFAVAGGVNYLLGAFGFQMLRAGNRYSIFLAACGLLYCADLISRISVKRPWVLGFCAILLPVGLWDQIPKVPEWLQQKKNEGLERFCMDRDFFPIIEKEFPMGASIFELPVHPYPEHGPVNLMDDYEHFRPYLHTKFMKFSYGTVKGREQGWWQQKLDLTNPSQFIDTLQEKNFSGVLINRRAYQDKGDKQVAELIGSGAKKILENQDFIVLSLPARK